MGRRHDRAPALCRSRSKQCCANSTHSNQRTPRPLHPRAGEALDETPWNPATADVRVVSLRGADTEHLVLSDVDLQQCIFSGAFHRDQLRLEGHCVFSRTPTGLHWYPRLLPHRWSKRITLAEEHHWRASRKTSRGKRRDPGWATAPADTTHTPRPDALAATYRQLRKGFEDTKNEPDAADFYYGEMEMRRQDTGRPWGERWLLWVYWLLSGYGLRAMRALGWLIVAVAATVFALMLWGLPTAKLQPRTVGTLIGRDIALTTSTPAPQLTGNDRITLERAQKAVIVAFNAAVFRAPSQNLTTPGTVVDMAARFIEPALLALAVLAVRGRVKR